MKSIARTVTALGAAASIALGLAACGGSPADSATADVTDPELKALVTAAQEEGTVVLYGVPDEKVLRSVADRFTELYGVEVQPVRLVSADLAQRFSSEASSGAPASDLILMTHSPFYADALQKKWLTPVSSAGIPDYPGDYPADYLLSDGDVPVVSLVPTSAVYNTDKVSAPPESWQDYADPKYRGQLAVADPATSPANLSFWQLMRDTYGDDFLRGVAANEPTWHNSAVPGTQAVAAGEDALGHPGVEAIVRNLTESGAPVKTVVPGPTTGPEIALGLTAGSEHPNAAKLFAHFVLSKEGSTLLAEVSGAGSPYGTGLPDGFERPQPVSAQQEKQIKQLLGSP
ncbi:ABC transporter substrate-binding protein [Prauserella muralis]|uniref:ABC transporter substrate-binding protein n=1 Tax=Prauserella muralis TaxID=588067 RepID=A0A2V4AMX2_9PSEU|nr:extracellular solute-binding protein [Prauserella muralis]PXY21334.1 ABC transporter substrate-binding protein [Prauserella muralis]TWE30460.1 iron(III) transport system substrate-binding protein [Prauserella muralis]